MEVQGYGRYVCRLRERAHSRCGAPVSSRDDWDRGRRVAGFCGNSLETGQACLVVPPDLSKHSYSGHTLCGVTVDT